MTETFLFWNARAELVGRGALADGPCAPSIEAALATLSGLAARALELRSTAACSPDVVHGCECSWSLLRDATGELTGVACHVGTRRSGDGSSTALSERLRFENLITQLSTHFIDLKPEAIDGGINHALRSIGEFCTVDRAYIFLFSERRTSMINTHEWCAPGIEPQIEYLQDLPTETFPWWVERILQNQVIHIPRVADMVEEAAAEKAILEAQAVKSIVVVPLLYQGASVGFVGFDAVQWEKTWSDEDIALLRLVGEMLISAIERRRGEEQRRSLEAQLIQARSLENVAKLAGGVAHDFNNLLTIMLNYTALLKDGISDPKLSALAGELLQVTQQGADLTRQLLLVGRRGVIEPVLLNVNTVLHSLQTLLHKTVGETVSVEFDLASDLELVRMGLPQLEQVIMNLVTNARDAMPDGGRLLVRTRHTQLSHRELVPELGPGRYVVLEVADSGTGMSPEVLRHVLEPFFTTKGHGGTGLGLSTVHGIVRQAGGQVTIESALQAGTTVSIHLPVAEGTAMHTGRPPDSERVQVGRRELVLLVEDSARLRALVRELLLQNGYRVLEAGSPEAALRICADHADEIDLLLTDVIMPGMSGRRLAELLAEQYRLHTVAYMSGYDDDVLLRQGIVPDGTWFLQKPFPASKLLRIVRGALDARDASASRERCG